MERGLIGLKVALLGPLYGVDMAQARRALVARGAEVVYGASPRADVVVAGPHARLGRDASARARWIGAEQLRALAGGASMASVFTLVGARLVVAGTLAEGRYRALAARLRARGAEVVGVVSKRADAVIVGERAEAKAAQARALGVPVLGSGHLRALLGGASLRDVVGARGASRDVWAAAVEADDGVNAALVAVRGWAYGGPSEAAWEAICGVLDGCDAAALPVVMAYAEQATAGWPRRLPVRAPGAAHELRRVPTRWMREAMAGRDSAKLAACRVLVCDGEELGSGRAARLLECAGLAGLRGLYVPNNLLSSGFCARLERGDVLPNLEVLDVGGNALGPDGLGRLLRAPLWARLRAASLSAVGLGACDPAALAGWRAPSLRALDVSRNGDLSGARLRALACAELPALERLDLSDNGLRARDIEAVSRAAWPRLRVLKLKPCAVVPPVVVRGVLESALGRRLERLEVGTVHVCKAHAPRLDGGPLVRAPLPRLRVLDVALRGLAQGGVEALLVPGALPALRVLRLAQSELPGAQLGALLAACPGVRTLDLSACGLGAEAIDGLAKAPAGHPLERLVLADNRLGADDLARLLRLPVAAGLRELDVRGCRVETLGPVAAALEACGSALRLEALRVATRGLTCDPTSARRLLACAGLGRLERLEVDLCPTLCPDPLREAFRARFGV